MRHRRTDHDAGGQVSVDRNIDAELRFHFDARIEELVGHGMSHEEAHAQALSEFGDVTAVRADLSAIDHRVARRRSRADLFDGFRQDVAYAARSLWRTPAVSLTIIATLALGLGVNAAMFSLLDVIFLRPPTGVAHPEMVRRVWAERRFRDGAQFWPGYDYGRFAAIERSLNGQADLTLYKAPETRKLGRGENAPTVGVSAAAASFFPLLEVTPQLGRFYAPDEDRLDAATPVAVISDAFWKRELDGSQDAIGRQITLSNERFTIIGVAPPGFSGVDLDATDVWLPLSASLGPNPSRGMPWWQNRDINGFQILLRLHPNAREGELVSRTTATLRHPEAGVWADSLTVAQFGSIVRARGPGKRSTEMSVAIRLAGVALIVLIIACANVVNLLLARALKRRREIAVRIALGVSRLRLVRMLVTEGVLLAIVAMLAAVAAATWGGALLRRLLMPDVHFAESPLNWRMFAFALVAAVVAGGLAGLVPALQSASPDLSDALKSGAREGGGHRSRLRNALVMCQAALSVMLLVGAVLFVRSLSNVKSHDIGFSVDRLGFASVRYDQRDSARDAAMPARLRGLEPRLTALPGVEHVAFAATRPKWSFSSAAYVPDVDTTGRRMPWGIFSAVSPGYFAATGMKLLRGTDFSNNVTDKSPYTVIVNQTMADAIWPDQNPIGHCIYFKRERAPQGQLPPCSTVIGVVQTALFISITEEPQAQFYVSLDHSPIDTRRASDIVVRASPSRLAAVQKSVTDLLRAEFPGAIPQWTTMERVMEPEYRPWQLGATLFTLFGMLALCVAGIGIYSTVSYAVNQRTHEFGVRIALGARATDVLRQVLGEGLRTVTAGVVIGILMTFAASKLVASLLYGIAPRDPAAMTGVAGMLLVVAGAAALLPAWRAARADPVAALRAD
jgi:predicted permease